MSLDQGLQNKIEALKRELDRVGILWPGSDASFRDRLLLAMVTKAPVIDPAKDSRYWIHDLLVMFRTTFAMSTEYENMSPDAANALFDKVEMVLENLRQGIEETRRRTAPLRTRPRFRPRSENVEEEHISAQEMVDRLGGDGN